MPATVSVIEMNGVSPNTTLVIDPSNLNMGSIAASALNPSNYPITAKADGHSFEKWLKFRVVSMGGSAIVDNLKVWLSNLGGGFKKGEGMSTNLRTIGYVSTNYPVDGPVETDSAVATQKMPEKEPASANVGIAGSLSGELTSPGDSDWIVLQLDVTQNTPAGTLNQKTITFQFDEQ